VEREPQEVEEGGKVVGIVSRADVLKVFMRPDEEIRQEVVGDVLARMLSVGPDRVRATVRDGVVTVEGWSTAEASFPFSPGWSGESTVWSVWRNGCVTRSMM